MSLISKAFAPDSIFGMDRYETAGRGSLQRRANDWIAEKRSPVISVARSRVCGDGRGIRAAHPVSPAGAWRHGIPVPGETGRRGGTSAEHWMLIGKWD